MRTRDQKAFLKAAEEYGAWIFERSTNQSSLQYIGKALYQSKPISSKPKTADKALTRRGKQVEGLVVDPFRWPEAFEPEKLAKTRDLWADFRVHNGLGEYLEMSSGFRLSIPERSRVY